MLRNAIEITPSHAPHYARAIRHVTTIIIAIAIVCSPLFVFASSHAHPMTQMQSSGDLIIYDDNLASIWQNWSWNTTVNFSNASPTANNSPASMAITFNQPWAGALFGTNTPIATAGYIAIAFQAYASASANQLRVFAKLGATSQDTPFAEIALPPGVWTEVTVPLSQLGNPESISAIAIQDNIGSIQPTFFVDDLRLVSASHPTSPATPEAPEAVETESKTDAITPAPTATSGEISDPTTNCCSEPIHKVHLPLMMVEATATASPEPTPALGYLDVLPINELNGPTLGLTMTLDGRIHLAWTAAPDALLYNLRYGTGDRSEVVPVTDTQWSGNFPITDAAVVTFSVIAITSGGTSHESNVIVLDRPNTTGTKSEGDMMQIASTADDCKRWIKQLLYRNIQVESTSTRTHNRERWVMAGPTQCLSLLANELELLGRPDYWGCELMLRPIPLGSPAPSTTAWIERYLKEAVREVGSSQVCRQLKRSPSVSAGVSALRGAANSCASTGSAMWTLQMDKITEITPATGGQPRSVSVRYLFSAYEILCVQSKPISYITSTRIVYTDGTSDRIDRNAMRIAIQDLPLIPQPLDWRKTEAIAHRGDRVSSPDNTHEAIMRAIQKGAKYVEIDTQIASDGQVIVAHGSTYRPDQGFIPDAPTAVYGPTVACHDKNMEVDVRPFLTGNCDIGTQMALASEGASWLPKFRGERYLLLQNVIGDPRYGDYCGWFIEMKNSEHPTENKALRNKQLGEAVQTILRQKGWIERCARRGQNVWVTSFENSALDGVTDDRIHKLRVVSRFSLVNWRETIKEWKALGYDGVAIDLGIANTTVDGKPLPEHLRSHGLKVVAYTLLPGSQNQGTNQEALDKKLDFFLTDILDDLLIRNGERRPTQPSYRVALPAGESRALVIRNHEAYPITTTLFLDSYGAQPLPIAPSVPGDGWVSLPFAASPTNADLLVVEKAEVTLYRKPAYDIPNYSTLGYHQTYLIGRQTLGKLVWGSGLITVTMQHQSYSNVKPQLVSVGVDRAQFTIKGITMPTLDGRNEVAICPGESVSVSGRLTPATGWQLGNSPIRLLWNGQPIPASPATIKPTYGRHELTIVGDAYDMGLVEPRALNQKRIIALNISVNVIPRSGCS